MLGFILRQTTHAKAFNEGIDARPATTVQREIENCSSFHAPIQTVRPPLPPQRPDAILGTVTTLRVFLFAALAIALLCAADDARIALQGTWNIQLDPAGAGHSERWFERRFQGDTIFPPGGTDQGGYGARTVTPDKG